MSTTSLTTGTLAPAGARGELGHVPVSAAQAELGHVPVSDVLLSHCRPSPENDRLYKPIDPTDPEFLKLVESVSERGVREPIVLTLDGWIVSGHRRRAAAAAAGLTAVPARYEPVRRGDDVDAFVKLLREYNRQRVKTRDERLREAIVDVDPDEAYGSLIAHRRQRAAVTVAPIDIGARRKRCRITGAKFPFLSAIQTVVEDLRDFWPVSVRQIHYGLLNAPPLTHASKPSSTYRNDKHSYKSLCELVTRARLIDEVPMDAIDDETRPTTLYTTSPEPGAFIRDELDGFLKGYWRDLQASQPCHVELLGEKNTLGPILKPVGEQYCLPVTAGRGYGSLPPRYKMAQRFRRSGKDRLVLLILSDFDPDGEVIAESFARSMRDDFDIEDIHPIKVGLNLDHVTRFNLPRDIVKPKTSSPQYRKFVAKYGDRDVFEVEALRPPQIQQIVREAIDGVLDLAAFNAELDAEKRDAAFLAGVRATVHDALADVDFGHGDAGGGE